MKFRKFIIVFILFVMLKSISYLPYFNLFINNWVILFVLMVTVNMLWRIKDRLQFALAFIFLVIALICVFADLGTLAERMGTIAYAFLVFGIIRAVRS